MSKRKAEDQNRIEAEAETVGSVGPVRLRRGAGRSASRGRTGSRRKTTLPRRKGNKTGGIHQRANKRTSW
jgi:hypothetical protein